MSDPLLPPGSRLVHIGPHKTGSTAIQVALKEVRDQLPQYGAWIPSGPYRRRAAGWGLGLAGRPSGVARPPMDLWEKLVAEVAQAGDVRACISNEDFGRATPEQVERIVSDFGGERVHVVAVVRRLDRYLPSQWQERVKARESRTFEEWLEVVLHGGDSSWDYRNVWGAHDVEALVQRWLQAVPPERFTLIVSDDTDHGFIPRSFERMLGLPEGLLRPVSGRSNRSLNLVEAELIRQINAIVASRGVHGPQYRELVRDGVTHALLDAPGAIPGPRIPLPAWALTEIRDLSDRRADAVAAMGVRVLGDPDRLRVPADVVAGNPDAAGAEVPLDAVTAAVGATLSRMIDAIGEQAVAAPAPERPARRDGSALRRLRSRGRRPRRPS
jgi:hypothetical protein